MRIRLALVPGPLLAILLINPWTPGLDGAGLNDRRHFLRSEISRHDALYYREGRTEISDAAYDRLRKELGELESVPIPAFGSDLREDEEKANHREPMLSLAKAYHFEELEAFDQECSQAVGTGELEYWIEPKVDGVAVSAIYEDGYLKAVLTRGDGARGNVIGEKLVHSGCLPARLPDPAAGFVELRGEAFIPMEDFHRINELQKASGLEPFSNPRNLAAGTILSKSDDLVVERGLRVVFFGWGAWDPVIGEPATYTEFRVWLLRSGLAVLEDAQLAHGGEQMIEAVKRLQDERENWSFASDGLVIKLNQTRERRLLGTAAAGPRWAIAYKFAPEAAQTLLTGISWQMGRTGVLTPVAELEPVQIKGRSISRASLHNVATVRRLGLKSGQRVKVELAGDVIPAVYPINDTGGTMEGTGNSIIGQCPWCGLDLQTNDSGSSLKCMNLKCPERVKRQLMYFCEVLKLREISNTQIEGLVDAGILTGLEDVFRLAELEQDHVDAVFAEEIELLKTGIEHSRKISLWQKVQALGIPGIGKSRAKAIDEAHATFDDWVSSGIATLDGAMLSLVQTAARYWK